MNKVEDFIAATKLNELLHKKEEEKRKNAIVWVLAILGAVAAVAAIAYAVYCYFGPGYLENFEDDLEDDFFGEEEKTVKEFGRVDTDLLVASLLSVFIGARGALKG